MRRLIGKSDDPSAVATAARLVAEATYGDESSTAEARRVAEQIRTLDSEGNLERKLSRPDEVHTDRAPSIAPWLLVDSLTSTNHPEAVILAAMTSHLRAPTDPDTVETSSDGDVDPDELVIDKVKRMRVLLKRLSESERQLIVLRLVVGLTAEQTAQIVGGTAGSVRVAQHQVLAKLKLKD